MANSSFTLADPITSGSPSSSSASTPAPLNPTQSPIMPDSTARPPRPLSDISESENRRRSSARQSHHSLKNGEKSSSQSNSRPNSEVKEDTRRLSGHIATITLNLNDYASVVRRPASGISTKSRDSLNATASGSSPRPVTTKLERPLSVRTTSVSSLREVGGQQDGAGKSDVPKSPDTDTKEGHPLLVAKRASLRPSPLGASYADVAKSEPSTPLPPANFVPLAPITSAQTADSAVSLTSASPRSSTDSSSKPPLPKSKPSWLRRASGTAILRSKSKSPILSQEALPASASLPPDLPARKGMMSTAGGGLLDRAMRPPDLPARTSYASVAAAGPLRSPLGDGAGKPAFAPPISSQPTRDNLNIRNRIAAWTSQAQSSSISRSDSSNTLASISTTSAFQNAQQRFPASAQRMIGSAGSAVQKGWAGLRSRGVGGSISNLSALAGNGESESAKSSRKSSRDRTVSAQAAFAQPSDGPVLLAGVIVRQGTEGAGKVFGKDITETGRAWGVADASEEDMSDWEKRRRGCLPAVVVRCVDYREFESAVLCEPADSLVEVWGPKEEGIFRISGRSSHITRLRKDFDAGADLNLVDCHPGDLDPHAVSGLFKSYLRDRKPALCLDQMNSANMAVPSPPLTRELSPLFEAAVKRGFAASSTIDLNDESPQPKENIATLLTQLPIANWFLLSDILKLLDLIPRHTDTNRMTLNALMLSLGPSLNIPGAVLTEFLNRRDELFSVPPPVSGVEAANDLIDFGTTDIPPVLDIETISGSTTPASRHSRQSLDGYHLVPFADKPKRSPLLGNKPSLTRLFGAAPSSSRKGSFEGGSSIVQVSPPRLELRADSPRLPSFESDANRKTDMEELLDKPLPKEPTPSITDNVTPDIHYPAGTVEERTKAFSTPIADLYSASATAIPNLRNRSSNGSVTSSASAPMLSLASDPGAISEFGTPPSAPANPASIIRRGQPVLFQASSYERHGRSQSLAATLGNGAGVKRKDDTAKTTRIEGKEEGGSPAKRLSAGPGSMGSDVGRTEVIA